MASHLKNECPMREYKCIHCEKTGMYATIAKHDTTCIKKTILCTNEGCKKPMQRQNLKRHLEICDHTEVPCKYQRVGCDTVLKKKYMSAHENEEDKHHLHMALDKIIDLDRKFINMEEESLKMEEKIAIFDQKMVIRNGRSFTFKVTDTEEVFTIASIYIDGYHMKVSVCPKATGKKLSVSFELLEGNHDKRLKWPFLGKINITILNQLRDGEHIERTMNISNGQPQKTFFTRSALAHDPEKNIQYLKDDTVYFRVTITVNIDYDKPWLKCTATAGIE